jgi:hypothetical protein
MKKFLVPAASLVAIAVPHIVEACPVCFGAPDSPQTKGAQAGILALLVVTVSMLAGFAGFFFIYLRRRIRMFEESNGGNY